MQTTTNDDERTYVHVPSEVERLQQELSRLERGIAVASLRPAPIPAARRVLLGALWSAHEATRAIQDGYLDGVH